MGGATGAVNGYIPGGADDNVYNSCRASAGRRHLACYDARFAEDGMSRFSADQLQYAASKKAYMGRQESIEFMKAMNINHAVGHWSAGDFYDRFAPPGYHS